MLCQLKDHTLIASFHTDIADLEGVRKIENDDFAPLIQKVLELPEVYMESCYLIDWDHIYKDIRS